MIGYNALSNKSFNMLIAGVIGSGKSYTENKIIEKLKSEPDVQMVFIDPKKVELHQYKSLPNCLWYADDEQGIYDTLCKVYGLMEARYQVMQQKCQKNTDEPHVFVFVDEQRRAAVVAAAYLLVIHLAITKESSAVYLASMIAPIANTGIFIAGMFIFFRSVLETWAQGSNIFLFVISAIVGVNFVLEFTVSVLFAPAVAAAAKVMNKRRR